MTFDDYQKQALTTAHTDPSYENTLMAQTIWAMGVAGVAGEVIEKWKKMVAYHEGKMSDEFLTDFKKELGDVVWYVAVLADSLGFSFDEIMQINIISVLSRQTGVLLATLGFPGKILYLTLP